MATVNFLRVCESQGRNIADKPKAKGYFPPRPKSPETLQREASEARYASRSNACGECFTARSKSGACACTV